jgi:hypothetical protein
MHDKVSRLRQLMSEAIPRPASALAANEDAWRAYEAYDFNTRPAADQGPRDIAVRTINRIAMRYNWPNEVQHFLDSRRFPSISQMPDADVEELLDRMRHLEDCIQNGCDSAEAPPAR